MESKTILVEAPFSPKEMVDKLKSITITDFDHIHNSPHAVYYGEIKSHSFQIKNVRYSPMSSIPSIEGDIQEGINHTLVKVKFDIKEHYTLTRNMYYATLIPLGIIFMLLSLLVLGGTDYQVQGLIASSVFIVVALSVVAFMKASLISVKKREIKDFISRIDGQIISEIDDEKYAQFKKSA